MKEIRYQGKFVTIGKHVIDVRILQESETAYTQIGELTFDADHPVDIEWGEKAKEEVICGSTATLHVISPGDRTYQDLYTIEPGRVRCDIYRDEALYWSGCIDTEFYEEPYHEGRDYTVELTFSDFGIMKRLKYNLLGMQNCGFIMRKCLSRCGLNYIFLDSSMISTSLAPGSLPMTLDDIQVRSENFYDEDGEASTLYDVIEGIMQPLGMKLIQRNGTVYIYDLNGMYQSNNSKIIEWNGDAQTMGADKVYNNARITWSTYAQTGNLLGERAWGFTKTDANLTALEIHEGKKKDDATYYSYHAETDADLWSDSTDSGFTLWTSVKGMNATLAQGSIMEGFHAMRFFKIVPQNDGSNTEGVAIAWRTYVNEGARLVRWHDHGQPKSELAMGKDNFKMIFTMNDAWLPPVEAAAAEKLVLNVSMELLFDTRFNPYEQVAPLGTLEDEEKKYDVTERKTNLLYIPVVIKFTSSADGKVYVWDNRDIVMKDIKNPVVLLWPTEGRWVPYTETNGTPDAWGYLAYYDIADRKEKSGTKGWKKNNPAINPHTERLSSMISNSGGGQYIPFPSMGEYGGKVSIAVYGGLWKLIDGDKNIDPADDNNLRLHHDEWDYISWILCALPKFEILNKEMYDKEINSDDVEYSATLNTAAEDGIDIDTICGTAEGGVPTARGAYFRGKDGKQITELTRQNRTAQAEDLLVGTLYSQYATRHTKLNGECMMLATQLMAYRERNQKDKKFICVSDVQDVRMETSDAAFIELSGDEYKNQDGK